MRLPRANCALESAAQTLGKGQLAARWFDVSAIGVGSVDRVQEAYRVLANSTFGLFLYGRGLGSIDEGIISLRLHLGFGNLMFKGGGALVITIISIIIFNILNARKLKKPEDRAFVVGMSALFFLSLSYSSVWSWFPPTALAGLAIFAPEFLRLRRGAGMRCDATKKYQELARDFGDRR